MANRLPAGTAPCGALCDFAFPASDSFHTQRKPVHRLLIPESNRCHTRGNVRAGCSAASGAFVSASFVGFLSPSSRLFKTHHAGEESEPHKTSGTVALLGYVQDFCPRSRLTKLCVAPV